jgi:hypothetical protein
MTRKISISGKARFFIACLSVALFGSCTQQSSSQPSSLKISARLEQLLSGISFDEQMRLKVKDIHVEKVSVMHLFREPAEIDPPWQDRYVWVKTNTKSLIIKDTDSLEELRHTLAAQHSNKLIVTLQGDQDSIWRKLVRERYEAWNTKEIKITIVPTPCDEINRIIYDQINSAIREQIQKQTDKNIDLDEVFDLLLRDELHPYLAKLDEVEKNDPCFKTFHLVHWLEGKEKPGYNPGEYGITTSLQGLLDPAINALVNSRSTWERYNLRVKVIGYTDNVRVRQAKIDVKMDQTGIKDWSKIEKPLDVHYLGCNNDTLNGKEATFIGLSSSEGQQIGQKIGDNCGLGAVRAYIAVVYIKNKLDWMDVEYSYATGGIAPDSHINKQKDDPQRRKIKVEFVFKAARTDK